MKTTSRKRLLISSVAMLLVAMLALGTATYAWFTTSTSPYADNFSAKTTKASTLLLADNSRTGWTQHLDYGVNPKKTMQPASGNGLAWVMGTSNDADTGIIDTASLKNVRPVPDAGVAEADYVFANELNLKNAGAAEVEDVKITFYLNTSNNNASAEYARVALVPFDGKTIDKDTDVKIATGNVYATNNRAYKPIIAVAGTEGDSITPSTKFEVAVTGEGETMKSEEIRNYKLYVWFEGQDTECVNVNSGQEIPGLKFEISSSVVEG